jgi:hypothetical protein
VGLIGNSLTWLRSAKRERERQRERDRESRDREEEEKKSNFLEKKHGREMERKCFLSDHL